MPSITAPGKVLVTGVNGFLGAYVAKDLLERDFTVVGTVRSATKGDEIAKYFLQYGDRFSYVVVQDMSKPGAFDEVISTGNFDGVAHTAAPVPTGNSILVGSHLGDAFNGATEGAVNILGSIKAHGPAVKRVVFTSSATAAGMMPTNRSARLTEADWNDQALKIVEEKGDMASDLERYMASKVLSERAAWTFVEENKDEINFDLVTVIPVVILGAPINDNTPFDQLGAASVVFSWLRNARSESELGEPAVSVVHVKDVAALHSECFIQPRAAGHRVFSASAELSWQTLYDALNEEPAFPGIPKGKPGVGGRSDDESLEYDTAFAKLLLGRKTIGAKDAIREAAKYHQKAGWKFVEA